MAFNFRLAVRKVHCYYYKLAVPLRRSCGLPPCWPTSSLCCIAYWLHWLPQSPLLLPTAKARILCVYMYLNIYIYMYIYIYIYIYVMTKSPPHTECPRSPITSVWPFSDRLDEWMFSIYQLTEDYEKLNPLRQVPTLSSTETHWRNLWVLRKRTLIFIIHCQYHKIFWSIDRE